MMPANISFLLQALAISIACGHPCHCECARKKAGVVRGRLKIKLPDINAVMDGFDIIKIRRSIGIADGNIERYCRCISCKPAESRAMKSREWWSLPGWWSGRIGQRQIVKVVVDDVVGIGMLKEF
jgi:hypothetical protein